MAFDLNMFNDNNIKIIDLTSFSITADFYVSSMKKSMVKSSNSLIDACVIGNVELVKELISIGHDVNASIEASELTFPFKLTPLLCAKGHPELIIILMDAGADPYFEVRKGISVFNYMRIKDKRLSI